MNEKETGSYYTPIDLVQAMVNYIQIDNNKTILEPSAGDGRIVEKIIERNNQNKIHIIELVKEKSSELKKKFTKCDNVKVINCDFLEYCQNTLDEYDIVIGNPPYINRKILENKQLDMARSLYKEFALEPNTFNNLWATFILGAIKILKENGEIFFVLPFEFLQVDYSVAIRNLLENRFNNIQIFVFEDKVFKDIQQQICLVHLSNSEIKPYIEYNVIRGFNLKYPISSNKIYKNKPLEKWTNSIVSDDEIELLQNICNKCISIKDIGNMSPGVVTGANDYFILDNMYVKSKRIKKYVEPIISKSTYLKDVFILDKNQFDIVSNKYGKVNLMKLNSFNYSSLPKAIKEYLNEGEENGISTRFKCKNRKPWYRLPNDVIGDIVFFKRYDELPRIVVNKIKCHTTDIGYNITLKDTYDPESVVFCFYNSLTLCLCEYNGRFYGGGVAELTPNELRKVYIPYKKIHYKQLDKFNRMIKGKMNYDKIVDYVNQIVLKDLIEDNDINILNDLRNRYLKRRKNI